MWTAVLLRGSSPKWCSHQTRSYIFCTWKPGHQQSVLPFITDQLHGLSYWMFRICFPGYAIRAISTHPLLVSGNLRTGKLWRSCDSHRMIQCPFVSSCFQPFPILQAGLPPPRREKGLPVASHCWPWRATSASGTPFPRTVSVIRLPPNTRWYWYPPANVMSNENITEGY